MGEGQKAVIFGVGDFARVACFYFRHDSPIEVAAFTVDAQFLTMKELMGLPVVPWDRRGGNVLDWSATTLPYGAYAVHLYTKDLEGRVLEKRTTCPRECRSTRPQRAT